jgi:excisionase family DNA binding protein
MDDGQTYSVAEAAARLGVSKQAVFKRIRRGSLEAAKVDGVWRVVLPPTEGARQVGVTPGIEDMAAVYRRALDDKDAEIAYLRRLLMEMTTQIGELRAIPAQTVTPPTRRRGWQFWKKGADG